MHGNKCPISLGVGLRGTVDSNLDRDENDMLMASHESSIYGCWTGVATAGKTRLHP